MVEWLICFKEFKFGANLNNLFDARRVVSSFVLEERRVEMRVLYGLLANTSRGTNL